ncbi:coiled-coil domain-containing protein 18 isoform X2 [Rana temporaria]|uniref:coiled-coil domain-containing protein 18 isoform X2 n=1 Tax=Rana temporaria TaxID=8407 RepID=UPI001AAC97D1|nr:coiled-coil domain-containing protein 18 isoform X2 [Rana temporaria]
MESSTSQREGQGLTEESVKAVKSHQVQTETLWNFEGHLSRSEHSLHRAPLGLTLEDLQQPSHCQPRDFVSKQKNRMALSERDSLRSAQNKAFPLRAGSLRGSENENRNLRDKVDSLQEQNASLASQNHSLVNKIKSMQLELTKSKSKVRHYESAHGKPTSRIPELEKHIIGLEAESEAQEKALRIAEEQLVENHSNMAEKEQVLQKFREELKSMKKELYECSIQCKRTEKQRNEALFNAEELTKAFQQYKKNVAEKIEKIQNEEEQRSQALQDCERERKESWEKCRKLENELEDVRAHLRSLLSEKTDEGEKQKQKCAESSNTELITLLTQCNQRVLRLESELENKEKVFKENKRLLQENKELKERLAAREDFSGMRHLGSESSNIRPSSQSRSDQTNVPGDVNKPHSSDGSLLIMDLRAQLSLKEAENQELRAKLVHANTCFPLDAEPVKLPLQQIEAEKYLQLQTSIEQLRMEKEKHSENVKELQRKLGKAQTEIANTKLSMAQRTSQFQLIQGELLEKASKSTKLEQEMTKKSQKNASLQKLLEERSQAYSAAVARNADLEDELLEFKAHIAHLEENISKEHRDVLLAFEKSKTMHQEQQSELLKQIEHLQRQQEMKNLQIAEQNYTNKVLQEDTVAKQQQIISLENLLVETRKELDHQRKDTADAIKVLENQVEEETIKVKQLESAMAICKEELSLYLQQLEGNREDFEDQIKKKSEEVQCLRKEMKLKTQSLQETSEENVRLQQTLQQQQQMLQQETARIGELEDTQAQLQQQISKLEFELEKQRSSFQEELKATAKKWQVTNKELALKTHNIHQLSNSMEQVKRELNSCREKLMHTEEQLLSVAADGESKNNRLSQMDLILQKTQTELNDKAQLVTLLQERVNRAERDLNRKEEIEMELQHLHTQLQGNLKHIEELQETLTKTHLLVEEKEVIIQALTEELRACKNELDERDHELLDMDQALKDRNWELKQRAAQLTQLDSTIRQHKEELEQKIIHLETALMKSELETKDRMSQISTLQEKLQEMGDRLQEKDFDLIQKDQFLNHLHKELEKKEATITEMEQTLKSQQTCISEQQKEETELSQQVRLARERVQLTHRELVETRQQLAEANQESDRLTHKLDGIDRLSREKMQQMKQDLEEAQDTICNLKTELEARNEVIKATNEVLILKESELTRFKTRMSGWERKLGLNQQLNASSLSPELLGDCEGLESYKFPDASDFKNWRIQHSMSDVSLTDISSLDLPKNMIDTMKDSPLGRRSPDTATHVPCESLSDASFNPLEYAVDDHCGRISDCPDLGTLSGMLKYIKQEMKLSEACQAHSPDKNLWSEEGCQEKQTCILQTTQK